MASALVDHGRKQVDAAAAAVLLWALVADRYIFNAVNTACFCTVAAVVLQ